MSDEKDAEYERDAAVTEDLERGLVALVFTHDPGRRKFRFLFAHESELRAMCWMNVGPDGSLYFNPRLTSKESLFLAEGIADGAGGLGDVEWNETKIADMADKHPKLSQHASGVVKRTDGRSHSVVIREVDAPTLLRQDDYAHPSRFQVIPHDQLRTTDIVVPMVGGGAYELDKRRPLTGRVFVAPLRDQNAQVSVVDDVTVDAQTTLVFPYMHLDRCRDLTYQFTFFNRPSGPWPEMTTSAIIDVDPRPESPA
jgi:hypothetical protein